MATGLFDSPWRCLLEGHDDQVNACAWSANGLATCAEDGNVIIFDHLTQAILHRFEIAGEHGPVLALDWSKDMHTLAIGLGSGIVQLWTIDIGVDPELKDELRGHSGPITAVKYNSHSRLLASGSLDSALRFWMSDTAECYITMPLGSQVLSMAWSPEVRTVLACGLHDGSVVVVNVKTRSHNVLSKRGKAVTAITWSKDGHELALGLETGAVQIVDLEGTCVAKIRRAHSDRVTAIAWSRSSNVIASAGHTNDQSAKLWDPESKACLSELLGHLGGVTDLAFSLDGTELATCSSDTTARVWSIAALCPAQDSMLQDGPQEEACRCVRLTRDGTHLATASDDMVIRIWNTESQARVMTYRNQEFAVTCIDWNSDGSSFCCCGNSNLLQIYNLHEDEPVLSLEAHTAPIGACAWSLDGTTIATCGLAPDCSVKLWDVDRQACAHTLSGHEGDVLTVEFSPDGAMLVSAGHDGILRLWRTDSSELLAVIETGLSDIWQARFSTFGDLLAMVTEQGQLHVWDLEENKCKHQFQPHSRPITSVAWANQDTMILTASVDFTVAATPVHHALRPTSFQLDAPVNSLDWATGVGAICGCGSGRVAQFSVEIDRGRRSSRLAWNTSFRKTRKQLGVGSRVQHLMDQDATTIAELSFRNNLVVHPAVMVDQPNKSIRSVMCALV